MPPKITPLPELFKQVRHRTKQLVTLQAAGVYYPGAWLEKRTASASNTFYWRVRSRTVTFPNGLKYFYIPATDLKAWRQIVARGRKIVALQRDIRDTQRRIDALMRRAKQRGITVLNPLGDPSASPEYYTPLLYIELVRQVLGQIDLDPASNPIAQQWIQADCFYTQEQDGLTQPWYGAVYLNPPYESPQTRLAWRAFFEKAIQEYQAGTVSACILLLNRSESPWYKERQQQVTAVCEVSRRIAFIGPDGTPQKAPRYYNDFLYLGPTPERFRQIFSPIGICNP